MGLLLLLFIVLPAVELGILMKLGQIVGLGPTIGLIVLTGIVGASLARSQGLAVFAKLQAEIQGGRLPADSMLDGLMILVAGALLVTPGVLTDLFGFLCLLPAFRALVKREIGRRIERAVEEQRLQVHVSGFDETFQGFDDRGPEMIDITDAARRVDRPHDQTEH